MKRKNLIKNKLSGYDDFLMYCKKSGKRYIEDLTKEDFIAYRAEYLVPRKQIEHIKKLLGFQEHNPAKETSSPQESFDGFKDSLQYYFAIDNLSPYKNILLENMNFDNRTQNCFRCNGYKTLADLLKSSRKKILNWKNFGPLSFDNLISTLKDFFNTSEKAKEKFYAENLQLINKDLDEFLRAAILNRDPQINLIISAFEKFCSSVMLKSLSHYLPDRFKNKRARPFLLACGLKHAKFFDMIPDDLTLDKLPEYLVENSITINADMMKIFIDELYFDEKACAKKIIASLLRDEREYKVVFYHAKGHVLEKIGKMLGITRERVRQIEIKSIDKFHNYSSDVKKIIYFLHAINNGKPIINLDDAKNFLDATDAELLWFFIKRIHVSSDDFHFDTDLKKFIFANEADIKESELLKFLPDVMDKEFFVKAVTKLAHKKNCSVEIINIKLSKIYRRNGKFFHRYRLTLSFECDYILKEYFPDGYKIADKKDFSLFVRYLKEIFDEKSQFSQRSLDAMVSQVGFLCKRGRYIHPDFVHVPPEIIEHVKNFIDSSDRTAITYKEIFETLKDSFVGTQVTNHYFLQGLIKFQNLPYTFRKDYLTKAVEINMGKEFDNFVAERGEVSTQEIKKHFVSFSDANINFLLLRCPKVIRIGDGNFLHVSQLDLQDNEIESMKKFLQQPHMLPINSRLLFSLFFEHFYDFMTRNKIQNHNKLFGVLQYMFGDEFNFSRPYIFPANIKNISNKKFLLHFLERVEKISVEDLVGICEENGILYLHKRYLIDNLRPDFIRVDEFTLIRPKLCGITDEIISMVTENIRSAIKRNGGWKTAQTFEDYKKLPQLEIPWNSFLLESVVSLSDDAPYTIKNPLTVSKFSSAVFLAEEFAQDDYQSFLTKVLIAEHAKKPFRTEDEIFDWIKNQGLCNKKLPKFFEGGKAFKLLKKND